MRHLASACLVSLLACTTGDPVLSDLALGGRGDTVVVLVHGYGSRPEDLAAFGARTDLPPGTRVLLPRAPLATHPPVGPEGGRMWWRFPHDFHDLRAQHVEGVRDAQRALSRYLDHATDADDRVILGGFSQGALLALDLAAHDPRPLAGLVLLSGSLMNEGELAPHLASRRGLPVRMTHGRSDDVLPFDRAEDLHRALRSAGLDVRFEPFDGGHEVTPAVSEGTAAFLREVAPAH